MSRKRTTNENGQWVGNRTQQRLADPLVREQRTLGEQLARDERRLVRNLSFTCELSALLAGSPARVYASSRASWSG